MQQATVVSNSSSRINASFGTELNIKPEQDLVTEGRHLAEQQRRIAVLKRSDSGFVPGWGWCRDAVLVATLMMAPVRPAVHYLINRLRPVSNERKFID